MECEHKIVHEIRGTKDLVACLNCKKVFTRKELDLTAFTNFQPEPIDEQKKEEQKEETQGEVATIKLFLTKEQHEWLMRLIYRKWRGCDFMLTKRAEYLSAEKKANITKSHKIASELLEKLRIV
jgi:hypothetical protein